MNTGHHSVCLQNIGIKAGNKMAMTYLNGGIEMNKNEAIFFAIIIVAYIVCALLLRIPMEINMFFAILLIIALIVLLALNYQQIYVNEKISKVCKIMCGILTALFIILLIGGFLFKYALFEVYPIFIVIIFITMFIGWFFKKEQ